jgi:hypothetical protein
MKYIVTHQGRQNKDQTRAQIEKQDKKMILNWEVSIKLGTHPHKAKKRVGAK